MGLTSSHAMCTLQVIRRGFNIYTPEIFSKGWGGQHLAPSTEEVHRKSHEHHCMSTQIQDADGCARILQDA